MVASPVFNAMFGGHFKEAKASEVSLPGKKVEEIEWMLDFIYPDLTQFKLTGDFTKIINKCKHFSMEVFIVS